MELARFYQADCKTQMLKTQDQQDKLILLEMVHGPDKKIISHREMQT